jgi:hypothetical protein
MNVAPDDFMPPPEAVPFGHTTVLGAEVIAALAPRNGGVYGRDARRRGHTASILKRRPAPS